MTYLVDPNGYWQGAGMQRQYVGGASITVLKTIEEVQQKEAAREKYHQEIDMRMKNARAGLSSCLSSMVQYITSYLSFRPKGKSVELTSKNIHIIFAKVKLGIISFMNAIIAKIVQYASHILKSEQLLDSASRSLYKQMKQISQIDVVLAISEFAACCLHKRVPQENAIR